MKRYADHKYSTSPWLGKVPGHWKEGPLKYLLRIRGGQDHKFVESDTPTDIPVIGSGGAFSYATSYLYKGESVLLGRKGTIDRPLYVSGKFWTVDTMFYTEILPTANARFAYYLSTTIPFSLYSTNTALPSMSQFDLANHSVPIPSIQEQQKIAQFLDYETAKIDALIDEQKRLIELLTEEVKSLALTDYSQHKTFERLENLTSLQNRPVQIEPYGEYTALGLYNRGRGLFHKEPVNGKNIGDSSFCYIKNEDLILSGQFAWEGAIAMATEREEGCVVSHRYPVLRGNDKVLVTEYLYALLLTKHGDFILNECSRGAAGRNRPLNTNALMKWKIRVPSLEHQLRVRNAVIKLRNIRHEVSLQKQLLLERRSALISAAVTGKIDVRDWQPPAGSDTVDSNASVQTERHYG